MRTLLIANRGEIAVRVARTAANMGMATVAVFAKDDAAALHTRVADRSVPLASTGVAAYLDAGALVTAALEAGCDLVHPGYGFLSENADFARMCIDNGLVFVGPSAQALDLFGDKAQTRALARSTGVEVLPGTDGPVSLEEAREFFAALGAGAAVMVKAVHGGGGRGTRPVFSFDELAQAYQRSAAEAAAAFGDPAVYVEQLLPRARHVEVQIVGDGTDVCHLWDRECSLQRERQKIVEIAPAAFLPHSVRERLFAAAVALGRAVGYSGVGTVEFLLGEGDGPDTTAAFIEVNPRLQVEHTVTEAVTGLDLVQLQLELAQGATLADVGLAAGMIPAARGLAVEARINLETIGQDGRPRPAAGTIAVYEPPSGPGVRVDGFGYAGYQTSARYDPLLAKLVIHLPNGGLPAAVAKTYRALSEFRIEGVSTNVRFLQSLLAHPSVAHGKVHTRFIEEQAADLLAAGGMHPQRYFGSHDPGASGEPARKAPAIDTTDPLGVLAYGKTRSDPEAVAALDDISIPGVTPVRAPILGTVVSVAAEVGDGVSEGNPLLVIEAMKLEHVVAAPCSGTVRAITVEPGESISEGRIVAQIEESNVASEAEARQDLADPDYVRPDLAEVLERRQSTRDDARPAAVERRRRAGQRTARENIADLLDPGTFVEYGALTLAARRARNTLPELIAQTPADGLVMGLGQVNGSLFPAERARCAVMSYDYTVLAGTQGSHNHEKLDRMSELALRWRLPVVFFTEGGGGRPGDTEHGGFIRGFEFWGRLSGAVPLIGVTSGRCFAGNAAILGCCDVIIATRNSALGMGGPAMIEGGGLGVFRPEEIGPAEVMKRNGVIDVLVGDETAAVATAKKYLSYFQGPVPDWSCADQRLLRHTIPENRLRAYDIREVIELLGDTGSVLELRPHFGRAMITALLRIEGRPAGLIANNPQHLGGAIDSEASDKAARFLQICEAFDLPVVSLQDTPGNMVGPEAEKTGLIRHCSRLFVIGANLTVPILSVVLRKSYGLGAIAMVGGSYQASMFVVSWPTGEFGGMGLEGSVKLGYRNELAAITDAQERKAKFDAMVARAYEQGKALARATGTSIDDVIDPAETRTWIVRALQSLPPRPSRSGKKIPWIDAW
jgi:acetyl/propionyl-CoA carboxylase alpha subunit/acetyl-CoA carboxylase carboxyltransferase component